MPKLTKAGITFLILLASAGLIYALKVLQPAKRSAATTPAPPRSKGHSQAPVKIVEYIDFQCPSCANGWQYLSQFHQQHPDILMLEVKYFPLTTHRHAFVSARYAECAERQGQFWPLVDRLFQSQNQWKGSLDAEPYFQQMAQDLNLNLQQLKSCLEDVTIEQVIRQEKMDGQALGIRSTPTYFINGKMVVGTKSLAEVLTQYVNSAF